MRSPAVLVSALFGLARAFEPCAWAHVDVQGATWSWNLTTLLQAHDYEIEAADGGGGGARLALRLRDGAALPCDARASDALCTMMLGKLGEPATGDAAAVVAAREQRLAGLRAHLQGKWARFELRLEPHRADAFVVSNILPVDDADAPPPPPRPG